MVARMARIGLVPGKDFDAARLGAIDAEALKIVPKLALLEMGLHLKKQKTTNGWLFFTKGVGQLRHRLPHARHGQPARPGGTGVY